MNLSTIVPINPLRSLIDYNAKVVCLGSCFAQNIGHKLQYYGFDVLLNPFGIVFNPYSLAILIEKAVNKEVFTLKDVEQNFSYYAHSVIQAKDEKDVLFNLNNAREQLSEALKNCSHLFITLGTAWVYRHIEKDLIVANCHKQPQGQFSKELLSNEQLHHALTSINNNLRKINPAAAICYTLSPVRHLKDGFIENTRSKSRLHEAIQSQVDEGSQYFPAYEIVMDELRDYRFYKRDMIHLNDTGIDYVWLCFRESGINKTTHEPMHFIDKYQKLKAHRSKNMEEHLNIVDLKKQELLTKYPYLKLS